jgi:hypothetical protein
MKKIFFLSLLGIIFGFLILFIFSALGNAQSGQNTSRWDNYSGAWDLFTCYNDSTTQDSLWFEQGDTLYTEAFKLWPNMSVEAMIVDTTTGGTDSVNVLIKFLQSGETWINVVKENFVQVKDLTWRSTSSIIEVDSLTATGRFMANLTEDAIYIGRYGRFMIIAPADSKKLTGNYLFLRVNGWNQRNM